jgi:hypothetical protein
MAYHPANPRGTTTRTDDQGEYLAFHKICNNCQVELTSRNRAQCGSLKCMTCAATSAREKLRAATGWPNQMGRPRTVNPATEPASKPSSPPITKADRHSEAHHTVSPERQRIHALLTRFLLYPTLKSMKDDLLAGLVDYEIKERFRFL